MFVATDNKYLGSDPYTIHHDLCENIVKDVLRFEVLHIFKKDI